MEKILSAEDKKEFIENFVKETSKYLMAYFDLLQLETHIDCNVISPKSEEKFIFSFRSEKYHKKILTELLEKQAEFICNKSFNEIGNLLSNKEITEASNQFIKNIEL